MTAQVLLFPRRIRVGSRVRYTKRFLLKYHTMPDRVGTVSKMLERNGKTFVMVDWDDGARSGWEEKYMRLDIPEEEP